jgi:predicted Zn-dependent protease
MNRVESLQALLARGPDGALLRYSLGLEHLKLGQFAEARTHLERATALDPDYSAAWKLLGKACAEAGDADAAMAAYRTGIAAAERKGDVQAAKEMRVFLARLERARPGPDQ